MQSPKGIENILFSIFGEFKIYNLDTKWKKRVSQRQGETDVTISKLDILLEERNVSELCIFSLPFPLPTKHDNYSVRILCQKSYYI